MTMHHTKEIPEEKLLEELEALVARAESQIFETFQTADEMQKPPAPDYFALLDKKAKEGLWVLRLGFGNNDEFSELVDRYPHGIPAYQWILAKTTFCKRMLMVDEKELIFCTIDETKKYFLTRDPALIQEHKDYFEAELRIVGVIT